MNAWKIVLKLLDGSFISAFSRCRKQMQLFEKYMNDSEGFYVWTKKQDALDMLRWLKAEKASILEELHIPPKQLAVLELEIQGVNREYKEYGGKWEEGIPAMIVKQITLLKEISE